MNLLNQIKTYEKSEKLNIDGTKKVCNCENCINKTFNDFTEIFLIKFFNYKMACREREILNIINLEYWYKDIKTKSFIWKSLHVHGDKYIYHKTIYIKSKEKVWIECRNGHCFPQTPNSHKQGNGCLDCCGKRKLTKEEFIKKATKIHDNKYDYSKVEYINNHTKIIIICKKHGDFKIKPNEHLQGHGCYFCGIETLTRKQRMSLEEFIKQANEVHGEGRYDYSEVKYINYGTDVWIICNNHNKPYKFPQTPRDHLSGKGCYICGIKKRANNHRLPLEIFINRANKKYGIGRYDYSKVKYITMNKYVCIICNNHNEPYEFWKTPHSHLIGAGCPLCNESIGSSKIRTFLINHNIEFETEKIFNNCKNEKNLRFDFYSQSYNLCIEFDGEQHFEKVNWNGKMTNEEMEENLIINQYRDQIKNNYCKNNNINLLRIRYDEDVEEKLIEYFQNFRIVKEQTIFDL